jgi:enoyl-CoA hydratase/carnithine racemase
VAHTEAFARQLAAKSPLTLAIGKDAFYRQAELPLAEAYTYAGEVMISNLEAGDAQEGVGAFIEKRVPVWHGR